MAEVIENTTTMQKEIPSMCKANAGLTLGIIGTALAGLTALGGLGSLGGLFVNKKSTENTQTLTNEEIYLERQQCQNYLNITKDYYEGKAEMANKLTNAFFDAYQRDVDNSFKLYQYSRDNKDELNQKINDLTSKVDVMAAVRPYQDALIDSKINQNALIADFNLARRTCKMIEGQLVLPSTPTITGYGSYPNPYSNVIQ